ncbi:MAG: N-acetyl-gamma-glutamyl-phosphate reductase [Elusimicrobia bacterium]|nr:N-acetyl-gamma-glutamyl-phosphate reductase [Elusimicrobiota bacterium]
MIRVAVVGATGYTGGELLRILLAHPEARVDHVTSESRPGQKLGEIHPFLRARLDLTLESFNAPRIARQCDVAFFALPHGVGSKNIADFVTLGKKAIDLSADFRLKNVKTYEAWYKVKHASPELLKKAVYGLPELYRKDIPGTPLIANPGCYATTTILALTPLVRRKWLVPGSIIVDAKSGVSGAGKKVDPMYLYCEATENFQAYAVAKHRHVPEIEQVLGDQTGRATTLTFVPHLVPMTRGILVTAYGTLKKKMTAAAVRQAFEEDYGGERFIRLLPEGRWPQTKDTAGTNYVDINVTIDERNRRVVVLAALDNLVKGASGQAVQNMNLLFGLPEAMGIK